LEHQNYNRATIRRTHHALLQPLLSHCLEHKASLPLIEAAWEEDLYGYMRGKAIALECALHAIIGMADHTHVVISIPPKLAVATLVGHLKGASSHHVNDVILSCNSFAWQSEYGVFTFSEKSLSNVVSYVKNQKKHHGENNLTRAFENI
jgi:putative transposase